MAHSLISAYGLDQCMTLREPKEADKVDMTRFHTDEYIDFLERVNPDNGMALTGAGTRCEWQSRSRRERAGQVGSRVDHGMRYGSSNILAIHSPGRRGLSALPIRVSILFPL